MPEADLIGPQAPTCAREPDADSWPRSCAKSHFIGDAGVRENKIARIVDMSQCRKLPKRANIVMPPFAHAPFPACQDNCAEMYS